MSTDAISDLADRLSDRNWSVRQKAVDALARYGPDAKSVLPTLRNFIRREDDEDARASMVRAISSIEDDKPALVAELITYFEDRDEEPREAVAIALAELGSSAKDAVGTLWVKLVSDVSSTVRHRSAQALVSIEKNRGQLIARATDLLKGGDARNAMAGATLLRVLVPFGTESTEPLNALWEAIRDHADRTVLTTVFLTIAQIMDQVSAIQSLLSRPEIVSSKKSYLLISPAIRNGLNGVWRSNPELVLRVLVGALELEQPGERESAIQWLTERSAQIPATSRAAVTQELWKCVREHGQGFRAVRALDSDSALDQLLDESIAPEMKARILLTEVRDALDSRWQNNRINYLKLVLTALEDREPALRLAAANWLGEKAAEIPREMYGDVLESLTRRQVDPSPDVQNSANAALIQLRQRERDTRTSPLLEVIKGGATNEDAKVEAIEQLVKVNTREALRALVREWVQWIVFGDKALVEITAELIRKSPFAIQPLLDQLNQKLQPEKDLSFTVRDAVLRGENPGMFEYLLAPGRQTWMPSGPKLSAHIRAALNGLINSPALR